MILNDVSVHAKHKNSAPPLYAKRYATAVMSGGPSIGLGQVTKYAYYVKTGVPGGPKMAQFFLVRLYQILTDFQNYFTIRIRRKLVIILSLKIPPDLKCVATLPCEMSSVLKATIANKATPVTTHF